MGVCMQFILLACVALGFGNVASLVKGLVIHVETRQLLGTWHVIEFETEGQQAPNEVVKVMEWVFTDDSVIRSIPKTITIDDKVRVLGVSRKIEDSYRIDPLENPKAIDFTVRAEILRGEAYRGIYCFKKDTLVICCSRVGEERPTAFPNNQGGSECMLITLKRASTDKKEK
jgi:uncharacterized protein (TIGR03067 family)